MLQLDSRLAVLVRVQVLPELERSSNVAYAPLLHFLRPFGPVLYVGVKLRYSKSETPSSNRVLPKVVAHRRLAASDAYAVPLAVSLFDVRVLEPADDDRVHLFLNGDAEVVELLKRRKVVAETVVGNQLVSRRHHL